jgi:putative ABC transport system ATP-binding protein
VTGADNVDPWRTVRDLFPAALMPAIEVAAVHRCFRAGDDETIALRDVTFDVHAGELVAVVGPSGSGKSTLLGCVAGIEEPDGGKVVICGEPMSGQPESVRTRMRGRMIGFLFQCGNLLDHLTVEANVALAVALGRSFTTQRGDHPDVDELLGSVGMAGRAQYYPGVLSGGEAASASLAVALANDPTVLLADEPTAGLDTAAEDLVLNLLLDAADRGVAVVVASHSTSVAAAADRTLYLRDGRLHQ